MCTRKPNQNGRQYGSAPACDLMETRVQVTQSAVAISYDSVQLRWHQLSSYPPVCSLHGR